ncbi:MAG: amidohydrolase [Clostridia bacterium]|nr:amidohydrolase [Clostridia bacterium]
MINRYAADIRRRIHRYPETGFDLERTLALIKGELEKIGVDYTLKYGKSSLVATINPEKTNYTIGIRADMDALPIKEENDVEYRSRIDGKMHACGHDAHTAMALTALKELNEVKDTINCRVKFLFQSAEEAFCGAKFMAEDGVMDDIDCIVGMHVQTGCRVGQISIRSGEMNANVDSFTLEFFGKASHVARQQNGIDANMIAMKVYSALEFLIAKEVRYDDIAIFNVGEIHGGTADNVISSCCRLNCTLRTWNEETENRLLERIKTIAEATAASSGGTVKFCLKSHYPVLVNDEEMTERFKRSAAKIVGEKNILSYPRSTGGEDFAYFAQRKPAAFLWLGASDGRPETNFATHTAKFDIDENALDVGVKIFKQFVFDNMDNKKD